ncbi:scavenger receptor cysteine-rich type 1 protein M130-like [Scleropages formosus]|uniref:scavenger receptor cysteine-rich type 1 protein M130-like n=1 Tax=Scleropages formosus TaxID=113540 RepID=UPI0010FAA99A|nr:scavenger receptor cysteine-rich type 1 protein M130-like [Scleropages formosus]
MKSQFLLMLIGNIAWWFVSVVYGSQTGDVRLINGPHNCTGDAQIVYNGMWVYLSLSINTNNYGAYWYLSNNISTGLCSQLGCGNIVSLSYNTISTNVLQAQCTGRESAVTECNLYFQSGSSWYSTLTCSGNVRLVNGSSECGGRVELLYNSQWVSLYDTGWTTQQSNVVCNQLGCGPAVATGSGETPGSALQALCSGAESALQSCSFQSCSSCAANNSRSVTVVCSGGVRLVNGPHNCAGDAQIFYNGMWVYLSLSINTNNYGAYWYLSNSISAGLCNQLGCGNTVSLNYNTTGSTNVLHAQCTGRESAVKECNLYFQSGSSWYSTLTCSGNVRLVNGSSECSGRVELLYSSQWVSLYDTGWTTQQSNVVCSQLGCGQAVATGSGETPGSALQALCSGAESALQSCSFQSCSSCAANKSTSVTVVCSGGVRLVNGPHNCAGDAQIFYNGMWVYLSLSINTNNYGAYWYLSNSISAGLCNQLGCGNTVLLNYNTTGSTNVLQAQCTGRESAVKECNLYFQSGSSWYSTLTCSGNVRLVNGSNECGGRVELLYSSQWVSLYDTGWTTQQSNLVCSQLGCGPAVATGSGETPGSALQALCSGAESALQSCSFQSCSSCAANNSRSVTVVCSGGVRLVNGSHNCTGDVQIFLDGTWMYFYFLISYYKNAPYWYLSNSITAGLCSQLGCGNTVSLSSNTIGSNVRLVNGSNECGGRVELLYSSQWVSLYDTGWTTQQSNVVCSQLGCGQAVATGSGETPGSALQALCSGAESALQSCSFQSCSSCAANKSTSVV